MTAPNPIRKQISISALLLLNVWTPSGQSLAKSSDFRSGLRRGNFNETARSVKSSEFIELELDRKYNARSRGGPSLRTCSYLHVAAASLNPPSDIRPENVKHFQTVSDIQTSAPVLARQRHRVLQLLRSRLRVPQVLSADPAHVARLRCTTRGTAPKASPRRHEVGAHVSEVATEHAEVQPCQR